MEESTYRMGIPEGTFLVANKEDLNDLNVVVLGTTSLASCSAIYAENKTKVLFAHVNGSHKKMEEKKIEEFLEEFIPEKITIFYNSKVQDAQYYEGNKSFIARVKYEQITKNFENVLGKCTSS